MVYEGGGGLKKSKKMSMWFMRLYPFYFTDNAVDTKKPPTPFVAINTGEKSPQSLRSRNLSSPNFQQLDLLLPTATSKTANNNNNNITSTTEPEKVTLDVKRKSLLNASYSSEEILLQAASSLQGLEGIKINDFFFHRKYECYFSIRVKNTSIIPYMYLICTFIIGKI